MKKYKKYFLACDLRDNPKIIEEYKNFHTNENAWPEVRESIKATGIINMEIFLTGNRLMMWIEVEEDFSFERKAEMDTNDEFVLKWEALMSNYQKPFSWAKKGEKWVLMEPIFKL